MLEKTKNNLKRGDLLKSTATGIVVRFEAWKQEHKYNFIGEVVRQGTSQHPVGYRSNEWFTRIFNKA